MPAVRIKDAEGFDRSITLRNAAVTFGRATDCDIVLDGKGVSRRHGRLARGTDGQWYVEDLGSKNGIRIGGDEVARQTLRDGDVVEVGQFTFTFTAEPPGPGRTTARAVTICDGMDAPLPQVERSASAIGEMDSRRLAALYEISKRLMDQRDVAGLIDAAATSLIETLDAALVVLGLTLDPDGEPEKLIVRPIEASGHVKLSRSVLRRTMDARRALLVSDTRTDLSLLAAHSIVSAGIRSALCVPMMRSQTVTGFMYVDNRRGDRPYDENDLEFASAVGAMVGTAIDNARLHEAELAKQRMEAELSGARRVQQAILPSTWPNVPGWEVSGLHSTCREVGGDYCDAILAGDGRLWLIVADVCGKGAPAALRASSVYAAVHALIDDRASPKHLLTRLNEVLLRREVESSFVTCSVAAIDPATGVATLSSAGHPYPIHRNAEGLSCTLPLDSGFLLGMFPEAAFEERQWLFERPGDTLVFYTDGVSEAMNESDEQFGEERILEALSASGARTAAELVRCIDSRVAGFRGPCEPSDDLTILACRRIAVP